MAGEALDEERHEGHGCKGIGKAVVERWLQGRGEPGRRSGTTIEI